MAASRNRRNRPLRTMESLESRSLFALDVCTSLPLLQVDFSQEQVGRAEVIMEAKDAGAGIFVPGNAARDTIVPLEQFPNDSLSERDLATES